MFCPSGTKHKLMLEGQTVLPRRRGRMAAARASYKSKRLASKGSLSVSNKSFQCELCEICVNSETQLTQVRHKRIRPSEINNSSQRGM